MTYELSRLVRKNEGSRNLDSTVHLYTRLVYQTQNTVFDLISNHQLKRDEYMKHVAGCV